MKIIHELKLTRVNKLLDFDLHNLALLSPPSQEERLKSFSTPVYPTILHVHCKIPTFATNSTAKQKQLKKRKRRELYHLNINEFPILIIQQSRNYRVQHVLYTRPLLHQPQN